jgi:hypothetical protein
MGTVPGNLSLGQHTGDGKFDGETFLGRTWMFFSGGSTLDAQTDVHRGVMKDEKLKLRDLHTSHTLGCSGDWNTYIVNLCDFYFYKLIGKLTAFLHLQEFSSYM